MKRFFLILFCVGIFSSGFSQSWKTNFGIDGGGWWGGSGMSSLRAASNPLIRSDFSFNYCGSADFYAEFLSTHTRQDPQWGKIAPGFGIKTKLDWEFFYADNSSAGGGESLGLNYMDVPFLLEYCLSYHQGVTRGYVSPSSSYTTEYDHPEGNYTHIITTTTPAQYHSGGQPMSTGIVIYGGPQICYLFKSFHDVNGNKYDPINDPNLTTTYAGIVGGFTFWIHEINFDISYQKGLQSIYRNKDLYINGFLFKVGINFSKRLYN